MFKVPNNNMDETQEVFEEEESEESAEKRQKSNASSENFLFTFFPIQTLSSPAGRAKNNNFLVAQRLSPVLMKVLGTEQRYLNANEIRKLVRQYKMKNNLKVSRK